MQVLPKAPFDFSRSRSSIVLAPKFVFRANSGVKTLLQNTYHLTGGQLFKMTL